MRALLRDEDDCLIAVEVIECYKESDHILGIESKYTVFQVEIPYSADIPYYIKKLYNEGTLDLTQFKTKVVGHYLYWERDDYFEDEDNI